MFTALGGQLGPNRQKRSSANFENAECEVLAGQPVHNHMSRFPRIRPFICALCSRFVIKASGGGGGGSTSMYIVINLSGCDSHVQATSSRYAGGICIAGMFEMLRVSRVVSMFTAVDPSWLSVTGLHCGSQPCSLLKQKRKKKKDHAFWRQLNEKPSVVLGCPGPAQQLMEPALLASNLTTFVH